jgi:SAM-dependent methyltransferase
MDEKIMSKITIDDFARSFGAATEEFSDVCCKAMAESDFSYRRFTQEERDAVILEVLRKIKNDTQVIAAPERKEVWQRGWAENLEMFKQSGFDPETLVPKFLRENQPIRYDGDYILPANGRFEYDYMTVFRIWLFQKYFAPLSTIYEFGCGTGLNLVLLAKLRSGGTYHGLDFVPAAVDLVNSIGQNTFFNIQGHLFDMIHPDHSFTLRGGSGVLTFGALEQLGGQFLSFIHYLLGQKPGLVVHVEPTIELYDDEVLFDHLAIEFHRKRGYTTGLLPYLRDLEKQGAVKVLKVKRLNFGSLFMEGYTYMIWQPA